MLVAFITRYRMQLGLALRVTTAALSALGLGWLLSLPMILWAVLTAVILTQMSVGKSVKATIDYVLGTLGGAIYAGLVAAFVPHLSDSALALVLAVAIAPLALLAATSSKFAAAPTSAAIVVLAPTLTHASSLASATDRVIEVALGGGVALAVSILIFPTRARRLVKERAADMLDLVANILPDLLGSFSEKSDEETILSLLRNVGFSFTQMDAIGAEARHEQMSFMTGESDFDPLRHCLLRLRHDLVMIGRAAIEPLPEPIEGRLAPQLKQITAAVEDHLRECARALRTDDSLRDVDNLKRAFDGFAEEITLVRQQGLLKQLSVDALEHVFALSFALEQWRQDLQEIARLVTSLADQRNQKNDRTHFQ